MIWWVLGVLVLGAVLCALLAIRAIGSGGTVE